MENTKDSNVCMACACPCEKHKEHTHAAGSQNNGENKTAAKVCGVCGSSDKNCGCK